MGYDYMFGQDLQLQMLEDQIRGHPAVTGHDRVKVYSIEAGNGKTQSLIGALQERFLQDESRNGPHTRSLVVTSFVSEAERIAAAINRGLALNTNEIAAYAYHSQMVKPTGAEIEKYPILIITHKRYQDIRERRKTQPYRFAKEYNLIFKNRTNLIIDEEPGVFPKYQVNDFILVNLEYELNLYKFINTKIKTDFVDLLDQLRIKIHSTPTKRRTRFRSAAAEITIDLMLNELRNARIPPLDRERLIRWVYSINLVFSTIGIIGNGTISIVDKSNPLILLDNNIILDASAAINPIYGNAAVFDVVCQERVNTYNNWTLHWFTDNTSKYSKYNKQTTYYKRVLPFIKQQVSQNEKALIITSKWDERKLKTMLQNQNIHVTNFMKMRGMNNWRCFTKCFILHTHVEPYDLYPLTLAAVNNNNLHKRHLIIDSSGSYSKYVDTQVQDYVDRDIASSMYQAILRINRNNKAKAEVFVFCNRKNVLHILQQQLPGIVVDLQEGLLWSKRSTSKYIIGMKRVLQRGINERASKDEQIAYRKKNVIAEIGINRHKFSEKVLHHKEIQEIIKNRNIDTTGQTITFNWPE